MFNKREIFTLLVTILIPTSYTFAEKLPNRFDFGKEEFQARCASCHGKNGKGTGPLSMFLKNSPPDLTNLSKNNDGIFPIEKIYQSISGEDSSYHGSKEMPIWGDIFFYEANCIYGDMPISTEGYVRGRILSLIEYINRLQVK